MTRKWLIPAALVLSFGLGACGDYDEKEAYDEKGNAAYGEGGNEAYDTSEGNAAYAPSENATTNEYDDSQNEVNDTAANASTNRY